MDRNPASVLARLARPVPRTESFEVLAQGGDAHVLRMLELGDRPLRDLETPGELGLTDGLCVAELLEVDLIKGLGVECSQSLPSAWLRGRRVAEIGELGS